MKTFLPSFLTLVLLLVSPPVKASTWTEDLFEWVTGWFMGDEVSTNSLYSGIELDSLRNTPQASVLLKLASSDTLAYSKVWPFESLTVQRDLDLHLRLLRQTVVVANPDQQLPLLNDVAVRIIYRSDQRPDKLLAMARRFADVQEVPFDPVLPAVLPYSAPLPTIIVVDDPVGLAPLNSAWHEQLIGIELPGTVLIHFGDAGRIKQLPDSWAFINCPLRSKESEAFIAQAIFGAQLLDGRLPAAIDGHRTGSGLRLEAVRGGFRIPELLGINREKLGAVDYHINRGIRYRAMPGAQLLVMKDGQVVYEKGYGHHVYRKQEVNPGDLYDLASITKAAATTLTIMKLYDEGRIDLSAQVREYLPELKKRSIGRYTIEQLLTHHTGIQSDLPLEGLLGKQFVAKELRDEFTIPVSQNRYLDEDIPATIRKRLSGKIGRSRRLRYQYSDLNYYLLQLAAEEIAGEPMDQLLKREFYEPLQLGKLMFNPAKKHPEKRLVPTIYDRWMRGGLLRGYVHDEGAALLGGVAGHAGLFSNAHDLGRLFQFLLDGGEYAGQQLLSQETIDRFTARNRYNYRALGFDRVAGGWPNVVSAGASSQTFGHLGFVGTSVWADPENDLVFVLLTNRVFPNAKNQKFRRMQIRGKVHQSVYQALDTWEKES